MRRELGSESSPKLPTSDWSGQLTSEQLLYAATEASVLLPLAATLKAKLQEAHLSETADLEMRALLGIAWSPGILFDRNVWAEQNTAAVAERDRQLAELRRLDPTKEDRNWDSPSQVRKALWAVGFRGTSTEDDALARFDHPLAMALRAYRKAAKRVSTLGEKWVDEHVGGGDRVCPSWHQIGAATGRMSCAEPNLQQVPRGPECRRCFVAPPGRVLVKADYSQIELRIAAKMSGDHRMLEAYSKGDDLHALTAAAILSKPLAAVIKSDRQLAKAVNFGLLYGMGAEGLMTYAWKTYGLELTEAEASQHRETFFQTYPGLKKWHDKARGSRPTDTRTIMGRRRIGVANFTEKLNTPVQGTGADGLKQAIAMLWERRDECPGAFPVLFVHDEIVVECAEADAERAKELLIRCMKDGMAPLIDPVPVEVDVSIGKTWGG